MIATMDELVAALARSQSIPFRKSSVGGYAVYDHIDTFCMPGVPGPASAPADVNGEFPTNQTPGALPFVEAAGGETSHVGRLFASNSAISAVTLYDRIWHNKITAFGTTKIPIVWPTEGEQRYVFEATELYAVIYQTLANTTAATWTVEFLDQDDTLRTATASYATNGSAHRAIPFDIPAGVTAIKEIVSFTSSVAQDSGSIGLVLLKRLAEIPLAVAGVPVTQDGITLGLPRVLPGACLALMLRLGNTGTSGNLFGRLDLIQG